MTAGTYNTGRRLSVLAAERFDVAGIDGGFNETWSNYTPDLPRPDGNVGYDYRYLWKLGDRFFVFFASDNDAIVPNVYGYSWAEGELVWTQEFDANSLSVEPWNSEDWDAAFDGATFYAAFTTTFTQTVDCGGGSHPSAASTVIQVLGGTTVGTYAAMETGTTTAVFSESFDLTGGSAQGMKISLCASANDPGNVYLAGSEGGASPCASGTLMQFVWVIGLGVSPSVGAFNPISGGHDRVYVREGIYQISLLSGEVPLARITDFVLVNDGDDVQLICRLPENAGGPHDGFNSTKISVFKPAAMQRTQQGETNQTTGTGWDLFYESPAFEFDTFTAFTKIVTPCWTENSGRRQRAIVSIFDATSGSGVFTDIRGLDANGIELHHLHDNTNLDWTKLYTPLGAPKEGGVGASVDPVIGGGPFYTPGIFYDAVADEYWALYENGTDFRSSVTTNACGVERWVGFSYRSHGFSGSLLMGQGPFIDDAFYVIGIPSTTTPASHARVIKVPICRSCMDCANA